MQTKLFSTMAFVLIGVMIAVGGLSVLPVHAEDLTAICYGGSFEQGWLKSVVKRFEEKYPGDKVHLVTRLTMQAAAKMRAQKDNVEIDVFTMDVVGTAQAEAEGLYAPLTEEKVPNMKNLLPLFKEASKGHPWLLFQWVPEVLWYNTEKFKTPPRSWKVMFDPKYFGRISFPDISTSHGVWMLNMASRIHGGNERNMDPGFEAIKNVRQGIHSFWTIHGQIQQLFARGEVWVTSDTTDRCAHIMKQGVPVNWTIPEEGAYFATSTMGIAKGTKHLDLAYRYINFVLDAQTQALNAKHIYMVPVVKGAPVESSLIEKRYVPSPDTVGKLLDLDWPVVAKERPKWVDRWRREIAVK